VLELDRHLKHAPDLFLAVRTGHRLSQDGLQLGQVLTGKGVAFGASERQPRSDRAFDDETGEMSAAHERGAVHDACQITRSWIHRAR